LSWLRGPARVKCWRNPKKREKWASGPLYNYGKKFCRLFFSLFTLHPISTRVINHGEFLSIKI
jgi:hypothetical protein